MRTMGQGREVFEVLMGCAFQRSIWFCCNLTHVSGFPDEETEVRTLSSNPGDSELVAEVGLKTHVSELLARDCFLLNRTKRIIACI